MSTPLMTPAKFAERILHQPLWPHQIKAAESKAFVTTVAAARRTGKTEMAEVLAMHTAFSNRDATVLIMSATEDAARRLTESIGARLNANQLTRGALVADNATRVKLANGSQIVSLPASQRQVRGYGKGVLLVILDEAGFMADELWAAAQYTALDERANGSRIVVLGSPWGSAEHFFRRGFLLGVGEDEDYASCQWSHKVNPQLDHAYLERERQRTAPAIYAAEVLGEWSDAAGSLFTRELLEACTADVAIPRLSDLRGPAMPILAMDWGVSYDRSAAVALYRVPVADLNPTQASVPRFLALPYIWPQGFELHRVVGDLVAAPSPWGIIASETNGVGAMPTQELFRLLAARQYRKQFHAVATSAASKTLSYSVLLGLMERRQLVLPRHPDLLRQLAGLRYEQATGGLMRIGADNAALHDDVADALALATLPIRKDKRVVSHLMRLANPRVVIPDQPLPEFDQPVVETGDGLRVHSRPSLQSVAGPALTHFATPLPPQPVGVRRLVITTTNQKES